MVNPSTPQLRNLYKSLKTKHYPWLHLQRPFRIYTLTPLIFHACRLAVSLKHRRYFRILLSEYQHLTSSTLLQPTPPSTSFILFLWGSLLSFLRNPSFTFAACTNTAVQPFLQKFCKGSIQHNFQSFLGNTGFAEWPLQIIPRHK